ncbi:MAG: hypothetical protein OXG74_01245 [Acidobacteria bacterium]|nr:hypothetical protein [Acidobacteriota bacterium]
MQPAFRVAPPSGAATGGRKVAGYAGGNIRPYAYGVRPIPMNGLPVNARLRPAQIHL